MINPKDRTCGAQATKHINVLYKWTCSHSSLKTVFNSHNIGSTTLSPQNLTGARETVINITGVAQEMTTGWMQTFLPMMMMLLHNSAFMGKNKELCRLNHLKDLENEDFTRLSPHNVNHICAILRYRNLFFFKKKKIMVIYSASTRFSALSMIS